MGARSFVVGLKVAGIVERCNWRSKMVLVDNVEWCLGVGVDVGFRV